MPTVVIIPRSWALDIANAKTPKLLGPRILAATKIAASVSILPPAAPDMTLRATSRMERDWSASGAVLTEGSVGPCRQITVQQVLELLYVALIVVHQGRPVFGRNGNPVEVAQLDPPTKT